MPPLRTIDDPRYVKAMSHPLRVRILARLGERTASPNELAEWLDAPLGTVAYHVRTLRRLGLIELRRETRARVGRRRGIRPRGRAHHAHAAAPRRGWLAGAEPRLHAPPRGGRAHRGRRERPARPRSRRASRAPDRPGDDAVRGHAP